MSEIGKQVNKKVGTGEYKKSLFGKGAEKMKNEKVWIKTGYSDCSVDGIATNDRLNEMISKIEKDGFDIVTITAVTSGSWKYETGSLRNESGVIIKNQTNAGGWGYGYGYSFTSGYIISAKN